MSARIAEVTFYEVICDECVTSSTFPHHSSAEAVADAHDERFHPTVEPEDG